MAASWTGVLITPLPADHRMVPIPTGWSDSTDNEEVDAQPVDLDQIRPHIRPGNRLTTSCLPIRCSKMGSGDLGTPNPTDPGHI
jgi:hypothetical protein